ncbi:MAG: CHAT domain-containing tetratricopeptide repeat protein [Acidobacteriota bacterium]
MKPHLAAFSFYLLFASDHLTGQVDLYRSGPIELHRELRDSYLSGRDVSTTIEAVIRGTGDHSFDTLLKPSASIRRALHRQIEAWEAWDGQDLDRAVHLYQDAARILAQSGTASERAFCYYYIAEIFSEQERYSESLLWLDRAIQVADSRKRPYLQGLLFQSRGYSLWFMDHFQASIYAFTRALEQWHEMGFREGMVSSWNNLASLYEELRLWSRADHYYRRALEHVDPSLDGEIRFYLHLNYAAFSHRRNRPSRAEEHLRKAQELQKISPGKFLLLESEILGAGSRLEQILAFRPQLSSLRIERALLLGRLFQQKEELLQARIYLDEALQEARISGLRYFVRTSVLRLGEWLEKDGQYPKAAELYLSTLSSEYNATIPEVVFPYWRAVSPLFDGWIRSLVGSGNHLEAWRQIQRLVQLRRDKGERIIESTGLEMSGDNEVAQLVQAGKLETHPPLPNPWGGLLVEDRSERLSPQQPQPVPFTVLEMWPDGNRIFAWVIRSSGYVFRELAVPRGVAESIQDVVDPLYRAEDSLPFPPDTDDLRFLYSHLIEPLEKFFDSQNILFIGHKELQALPLGMLLDQDGEYLVEHYHLSYLPSAHWKFDHLPPTLSSPSLMVPVSAPDLPEIKREEVFFQSHFPDLQVVRTWDGQKVKNARWIHVSNHFRLDERLWLTSGFPNGQQEVNVLNMLQMPLTCTLLSLGACDLGNPYFSGSPYWLGFAELFLNRGVQALLVSRWSLDDLASRIYRDFFALAREGLPMDEALSQAKRGFMRRQLRRGQASVSGRHPYFWAGVTYVGLPGKRLYPKHDPRSEILMLELSATLLLGLTLFLFTVGQFRRRSASRHQNKDC